MIAERLKVIKLQTVVHDLGLRTLRGVAGYIAQYLVRCTGHLRRPASQPRPQFQQPICILDLQL